MPFDPSPSLSRTFDAERLNALANHPEIRPWMGDRGLAGELDFTAPFLADRRNHAVMWDKGAFMFTWTAPQTYEVHVLIVPEGRGKAAYRKAREGIAYMLEQGMERLWARVAPGHDGLKHYTLAAGFKRCGSDELFIAGAIFTYDLYQWKKPCLQ